MKARISLALDIGGTNMRIEARDTATDTRIGRATIPTIGTDYRLSFSHIVETVHQLTTGGLIVATGMGVGGALDGSTIIGSSNLTDWVGYDLKGDFEEAFDSPVVVLNDCAAAALGEYVARKRELIYVIWGTGIGVSIVTTDSTGTAHVRPTELGHMIIDRNSSLRCGCGELGHLEAYVGGANLPQRFDGCMPRDLSDVQWTAVLGDLALGLRTLSVSDIGLPIVLGGGVACKQGGRLSELQGMVNALKATCQPPKLHLATGGEDSGLNGAAYAAQRLVAF